MIMVEVGDTWDSHPRPKQQPAMLMLMMMMMIIIIMNTLTTTRLTKKTLMLPVFCQTSVDKLLSLKSMPLMISRCSFCSCHIMLRLFVLHFSGSGFCCSGKPCLSLHRASYLLKRKTAKINFAKPSTQIQLATLVHSRSTSSETGTNSRDAELHARAVPQGVIGVFTTIT